MDLVERFGEYAADFERFFESDDPSILEPWFTQDAVYEVVGGPPFEGRAEGRDAVVAYLKRSVDGFDRRFRERRLEVLEGPVRKGDSVWLAWRVTYCSPGIPELVLDGEEIATFEDGRIKRLEDRFPLVASSLVAAWMEANAGKLDDRA
jgi:hypothetical protein